MRTSARSANLRALLADDDTYQLVTNLIKSMKTIEQEDIRGFRKATLLDPTMTGVSDSSPGRVQMDPITLELSDHNLLCAHISLLYPNLNLRLGTSACLIKEVSRKGVCYGSSGSSQASRRNSTIIYEVNQTHSAASVHKPAIIHKMINYSFIGPEGSQITDTYFFVQELSPIDAAKDPYRKFGFSGGYLCHRPHNQSEISCVIKLSQVVSHFALTTFPKEKYQDLDHLVHVLPLDRVCFIFKPNSEAIHTDLGSLCQLMLSFNIEDLGFER